jgi:hypothetical protein
MRDIIDWQEPFGLIGVLDDKLFLRLHMAWLVSTKQRALKQIAECRGQSTKEPIKAHLA